MTAHRSITLLAVALSAPAAQGQIFLKLSGSGGAGYASDGADAATAPWTSHMVSSSMSWSMGSDGHIHEQMRTTHTDTRSDGEQKQQVQTNTFCKDGLCQQEKTMVVQPTWHTRVRAALAERFFGPPHVAILRTGQPSMEPQMMAPPSLRGVVVVSDQPRIVHAPVPNEAVNMPPPTVEEANLQEMAAYIAGGYVAICAVLLAGVVIIKLLLHNKRSSQALAREPRLRMLADPLAPVPEEAMEAGMAAMEAAEAVAVARRASSPAQRTEDATAIVTGKYLQSLYARVHGNILAEEEEQSVRQYMCSLYERF